jgi:hypothetical protein
VRWPEDRLNIVLSTAHQLKIKNMPIAAAFRVVRRRATQFLQLIRLAWLHWGVERHPCRLLRDTKRSLFEFTATGQRGLLNPRESHWTSPFAAICVLDD